MTLLTTFNKKDRNQNHVNHYSLKSATSWLLDLPWRSQILFHEKFSNWNLILLENAYRSIFVPKEVLKKCGSIRKNKAAPYLKGSELPSYMEKLKSLYQGQHTPSKNVWLGSFWEHLNGVTMLWRGHQTKNKRVELLGCGSKWKFYGIKQRKRLYTL